MVKTDLKNILTAYQILTLIKIKNSIAEIKTDAFTCRNKEDNKNLRNYKDSIKSINFDIYGVSLDKTCRGWKHFFSLFSWDMIFINCKYDQLNKTVLYVWWWRWQI